MDTTKYAAENEINGYLEFSDIFNKYLIDPYFCYTLYNKYTEVNHNCCCVVFNELMKLKAGLREEWSKYL